MMCQVSTSLMDGGILIWNDIHHSDVSDQSAEAIEDGNYYYTMLINVDA